MLSEQEIRTIREAEKDLSPELQIIMLWLGRVTKLPAETLLTMLRDTIADWQTDVTSPSRQ